jgi:hypothetical protein
MGGGSDGERETGEGERGEHSIIPVIPLCVIVVKVNDVRVKC